MGNNDIDREYLPTSAWVRERTDEFARVRMKFARHIALVSKEGSGERVKVPTAADEKGEARILSMYNVNSSGFKLGFKLFHYYFTSYAHFSVHIRSLS